MSYPITDHIGLTPSIAATASYTPDLSPLPITTNNDYVFLCVSCTIAAAATLSVSGTGWVEAVEGNNVVNNAKVAVYYCKVASGTVATPTISLSTGTGGWLCTAWVERDADATNPIDSTAVNDNNTNYTKRDSATHTPTNDNCRIVWFATGRAGGSTPNMRMLEADAVGENFQSLFESVGNIGICQAVGSGVQDTKASTVKTVYASSSQRVGFITIAIKNKAGGKRAKSAAAGMSRVLWGGSFGDQHDATLTPSLSSRAAPTSRTINSIAVSTTNATFNSDQTGPVTWGSFDGWATNVSTGWQGPALTFSADIDMTGKFLSIEFYVANTGFFDAEGLILVLEDNGGTNWKAFQLSQMFNMKGNTLYTAIIDPSGTAYDSGGTLNLAQVRKITPLAHRLAVVTSRLFYTRNINLLSNTVLTGGNSDEPLDINYLRKALQGWSCAGLVGGEYPAVTVKSDVQIGDGTIATYFDATGTLLTFPKAYDKSTQREWHVGANQVDVTIKASASDTINLIATSVSATQEQNFTFDAASSASATYSTAGASIIGMAPTLLPEALSNATYSGCGPVATKGANLTNCIVTATTATSTEAAVTVDTSGSTFDGCSIDVTGTSAGYHLELGTSVTAITLTDVTFTGTPGTDKVHVLKTTGTVTITISGTTSLVAGDVTSAGATVVISAPVEYQSVTLSNYTTGSRIQIYDTTNGVELYNGIPAAAPQTLWTDSVAASTSGARDIRVRVAYVSGVTAKSFIEAAIGTVAASGSGIALSYRVNQTDDDTYNSNAVDGSVVTGITIVEGSTDRVQIAIAGGSVSWAQIYAYQCYWLFDVVGITDDGAFIEAPDTANYILTGFKIKNTHASIPLLITGGYGVDSTGSVSALYDTTGTSIFPAPAHVVPYATGSGVTPSDVTNIAAASATAAATAVWGDSKALTVPKFLGLK